MKKFVIFVIISVLICPPVWAKDWSLGNSNANSTTHVSGYQSGSSGNTNASAKASLFGSSSTAFTFGTRTGPNGATYVLNAGPYTWSGSNDSLYASRNFTFVRGTGNFTVGPVPVTVSGGLGASVYVSLSAKDSYLDATFSGSGSGDAKAGVGISGWSAGVKVVLFPLLGGRLTANSNGSGEFRVEAAKIYLRAYVEYLFGVGFHEHSIADFGPLYSQGYRLW